MTPSVKKIIPKTLVKNFTDYSNETTIHGVKYLSNRTRPLPDRIFWVIIFILSTSCLGYFVYKIGRTWMDHEVMITDRNEPIQIFKIPFPAITICPQIKIKREHYDFSQKADVLNQFANYSDFMKSDYGKKMLMATQLCREFFLTYTWPIIPSATDNHLDYTYLDSLPTDWINALQDMSPNFKEVFEKCEMIKWDIESNDSWKYQLINECTELFSTILTNEGICFTFNTIDDILRVDSLQTDFQYHNITQRRDGWEPEKGYNKVNAYPFKGIMAGEMILGSGISLVLNANLMDTTPFCWPEGVGYKITLHSPSAYPHMYNNYILLEYGKEYEIAVVPQTIETSDDLRSVTPEERRCFFNDERKLKFYTFYNEENCRLECYTNFMESFEGGVPFSSPRNSNTTNYFLLVLNQHWELPTFNGLLQEYMQLYNRSIIRNENNNPYMNAFDEYFNCNCLPECNSIKYGYKILKSNTVLSKKLNNTVDMNVNSAQTTIRIFFNEPSFIGQKRVRVYTFETMISDFGGLLGLFMGGSLLSFFELIYFLTIRICFKHKEDTAANELNDVSCSK